MVEVSVHLLYLFLAFAEVLVLLASAMGLLGFVVWRLAKKILDILDAGVTAKSPDTQPPIKTSSPLGAMAGRRARQIPGGHNERF